MISEQAIIHPTAKIGSNVTIGPWTLIGPDVEIGDDCDISAHVVVKANTRMGKNNRIHSFTVVGDDPQDTKFKGGDSRLEIGDDNIIREYCSIHRGTPDGRGVTSIGSRNFIMGYVHIAHDCVIKSDIQFVNNTSLGGHVTVEDFARIGGHVGVHQFCTIGAYSLTTAAMIGKDVPPYVIATGNTAYVCGINSVGLRRRGFSSEAISGIRRAYNVLFRKGMNMADALKELSEMVNDFPQVQLFIDAVSSSSRGILR